jgi:glutamine synthetase
MLSNTQRMNAIASLAEAKAEPTPLGLPDAEKLFGSDVFGYAQMEARLPKDVCKSLKKTIETGAPLDPKIADVVAAALKDWAMAKGATHYAHVFHPLTGLTAEKHDSFLNPDNKGGAIAEFSGKLLVQGEPDASSFPSGGIRETSQARGYTAWDPTSFAYVLGGSTLCIPTAFVSWTGEALDNKTPLLRAMKSLNRHAQRVLKLFGHENAANVVSYAGAEQEYFLIDRRFYLARTDLLLTGRTLFGAKPAKGQEFEDQYFGAIPDRILSVMLEMEKELFKLGIPVKTRHNEVAPSQYEIAPVFESGNIATDHQQLVMLTMRKVAERHGFVCLLHEKPFAGVNGSGKHLNFSFGNSTQGNLLDPGETPHENGQFLVFCTAVIRAVSRHAGLLRATIATAANDHRLGANEAPPAIISIFLGEQLADVFEQVKAGGAKSSKGRGTLEIGVDSLPKLPKDPGDRNRTSPFAFCGNRFEFRAVGSSQSISVPLTALTVAIAESLDFIATKLETAVASGKTLNASVQTLLAEIVKEHGGVIFGGNGYSAEWHAEAEKRGLPNLRTAIHALPVFDKPETVELFDKYEVLNPRELHSRMDIMVEQYVKTVLVEAKLTVSMTKTQILPAALRYQTELAQGIAAAKSAGLTASTEVAQQVTKLIAELESQVKALEGTLAHTSDSPLEEAKTLRDKALPTMTNIRAAADALEGLVATDVWPLPSYEEMLFIR